MQVVPFPACQCDRSRGQIEEAPVSDVMIAACAIRSDPARHAFYFSNHSGNIILEVACRSDAVSRGFFWLPAFAGWYGLIDENV